MEVKTKDVFDWYVENIKLIQRTVWKAMYRPDRGTDITYDDLMAHCLDKIPVVFSNYDPEKGTKLSTFVMGSLYFECMKYITKNNMLAKRYKSYEKLAITNTAPLEQYELNSNVQYIEDDDLSDNIFAFLEKQLSATELRLIVLKLDGMTFEQMAEEMNWNATKTQKEYWHAFFRARQVTANKF